MPKAKFLSLSDQVLETLKAGIRSGRWQVSLPGRMQLAGEMGVSHRTVEAAIQRLAAEGWLISPGRGSRRRIRVPEGETAKRTLRLRILPYDSGTRTLPFMLDLVDRLRMAGYAADFTRKTLRDLGMDPGRVAKFVGKTPADAWVVAAGPRAVLEWFSQQETPVLALFGRGENLPIAVTGPRMSPTLLVGVRKLIGLGHRRIVMIAHEDRRKPYPAGPEKLFLDELTAHGIPVGPYNLPDWDDTADGLRKCLDSLFDRSSPTALILGEPRLFVAAQQHLARMNIHAPEEVSLFCTDTIPAHSWCKPAVSHLTWDPQPVIRRILRWAGNVAEGKPDIRHTLFDGKFVEGETIGPARR